MAKRIIKEYQTRRNEILDTAEKLFFTYGYESTPVEVIITTAGISKGTFYYYFKSKEELLDTLATERAQRAFAHIDKMIFENNLSAPDRMKLYFDLARSWKFENRGMLKALVQVLYAPSNILLREKFFEKQLQIAAPTLTRIVRQGVEEGCYHTQYPDDIAELLFSLLNMLGTTSVSLFLSLDEQPENLALVIHKVKVFENLFERILGAQEGTIEFADSNFLRNYLSSGEEQSSDGPVIEKITIEGQ